MVGTGFENVFVTFKLTIVNYNFFFNSMGQGSLCLVVGPLEQAQVTRAPEQVTRAPEHAQVTRAPE